jgi:predicted RNase H-like HicB family nuclease
METYLFEVALEPDGEGWRAFYPDWEEIGASTWGYTQAEALGYIQEVLLMIIEEFKSEGSVLPPTEHLTVSDGASVAVTV